MFEDVFARELARKLPAFLEPLAEIRRSSSESLAQVKQKQTAFTAFSRAATPFRQLADLWCAALAGAAATAEKYHAALAEVDKPVRLQEGRRGRLVPARHRARHARKWPVSIGSWTSPRCSSTKTDLSPGPASTPLSATRLTKCCRSWSRG